jgi:hypothetical protein
MSCGLCFYTLYVVVLQQIASFIRQLEICTALERGLLRILSDHNSFARDSVIDRHHPGGSRVKLQAPKSEYFDSSNLSTIPLPCLPNLQYEYLSNMLPLHGADPRL